MSHIVLKQVRKHFGKKHVLNGLDLEVGKGRSLVVIGGSGTGKSVMLKCILGILKPDDGEIIVGGENAVGLKGTAKDEYLARFGMLFQGSALFDSLTVEENIRFPLDMFTPLTLKEKVERVNYCLERVKSQPRATYFVRGQNDRSAAHEVSGSC